MSSARVFFENDGESALVQVVRFDALSAADAGALLCPCGPSRRWVREVASGRPYGSVRRLIAASDDVLADLSWSDVGELLAALGQRVSDPAGAERAVVRSELREIVRLQLIRTFR